MKKYIISLSYLQANIIQYLQVDTSNTHSIKILKCEVYRIIRFFIQLLYRFNRFLYSFL